MAGSYPDPVGPRLAYDRDGTQGHWRQGSIGFDVIGSAMSEANLQTINDENPSSNLQNTGAAAFVLYFPALRDISHIFWAGLASNGHQFMWSSDTTNGIDGTWTNITVTNRANDRLTMRSATPNNVALTGVRSLRWYQDNSFVANCFLYSLHLYGKPSADSDRLEFWHPTLDQPLSDTPAFLDWGDRPRSSAVTRNVRVKNLSASLTASTITVGVQALTDASPTYVSQYQLAYDGGSYDSTASIASLAPGAISNLVSVQQTLLSNAVLSLWDQRLYADAATWA